MASPFSMSLTANVKPNTSARSARSGAPCRLAGASPRRCSAARWRRVLPPRRRCAETSRGCPRPSCAGRCGGTPRPPSPRSAGTRESVRAPRGEPRGRGGCGIDHDAPAVSFFGSAASISDFAMSWLLGLVAPHLSRSVSDPVHPMACRWWRKKARIRKFRTAAGAAKTLVILNIEVPFMDTGMPCLLRRWFPNSASFAISSPGRCTLSGLGRCTLHPEQPLRRRPPSWHAEACGVEQDEAPDAGGKRGVAGGQPEAQPRSGRQGRWPAAPA